MSRYADIAPEARIGRDVSIASFTVIHGGVEIGDGCQIGPFCEIGVPTPRAEGRPLVLGEGSRVRSHTVLYQGSRFGPGLQTGHGATARENCTAGLELQLGTRAMLDGDLALGDYVKLHSLVTVAEHSELGDFSYLLPRVQLLNDPIPPSPVIEGVRIEALAVVAAGALLFPGVVVGLAAFVAGASQVKRDVPALHVVAGSPAQVIARIDQLVIPRHGAYHPWIRRHLAKYPSAAHPRIERLLDEVSARLERLGRDAGA